MTGFQTGSMEYKVGRYSPRDSVSSYQEDAFYDRLISPLCSSSPQNVAIVNCAVLLSSLCNRRREGVFEALEFGI